VAAFPLVQGLLWGKISPIWTADGNAQFFQERSFSAQ
jgi:hypothetical protein